jgi:hypothetical protein
MNIQTRFFIPWLTFKDQPRPWLARLVLLGARVTAPGVGSGAVLGRFRILKGTRKRAPELRLTLEHDIKPSIIAKPHSDPGNATF